MSMRKMPPPESSQELTKEQMQIIEEQLSKVMSISRDIPKSYNSKQLYNNNYAAIVSPPSYGPCRGNCEDLYSYCDVVDAPVHFNHAFGNRISKYGFYGSDPRQRYYVYMPYDEINGDVVFLIHGGLWYSGPNPATLKGFPFSYAPSGSTESLVKDLLDQGYIVVSLLYRLAKIGTNNADITSNGDAMGMILDDIENGINHFRTRMPACYNINVNDCHVVGESAGGHIALMYAYTRASSTYIKSVTSMYAPTNLRQFGAYMKNIPDENYSCGQQYKQYKLSVLPTSICSIIHYFSFSNHAPYYLPVDLNNPLLSSNYFTTNCSSVNPVNYVYPGYNIIQGLTGQIISTPSSSIYLLKISPALLTTPITIPTFIMHGKNDFLVPHNESRNNMDTRLAANGGHLAQNGVCPTTPMPVLTPSQKHLTRLYNTASHGFVIPGTPADQESMYNTVRSDIVHWINIH